MTDKNQPSFESTKKNPEDSSQESISHDKTTPLITNSLKSEFYLRRNERWDKPKNAVYLYLKIAIKQCFLFAGGLFFVLLFFYPRNLLYMALELVFLILNIKERGG